MAVTSAVMAGIAMAGTVASGIHQANVADAQAKAAASAAEQNAAIMEENARLAEEVGARNARLARNQYLDKKRVTRREQEEEAARMRLLAGASGTTGGTSWELASDIARKHTLNLQNIDYEGRTTIGSIEFDAKTEAWSYRTQAQQYGNQASYYTKQGSMAKTGVLLSTGAKAFAVGSSMSGSFATTGPQYIPASASTGGGALATNNWH